MDTSNRLPLVLGELKVPASELTSVEWAAIVERAAELCKPQLNYFAGFNVADQWAHNESIVQCKPMNWGSKDSPYYSGLPFLVVSRVSVNPHTEERLLLNKAAKFLVWTRVLEPVHKKMDIRWTFTPLTGPSTDEGMLPKYMRPDVGGQVLMHLEIIASDAYTKRLSHLDAFRELKVALRALRSKIG